MAQGPLNPEQRDGYCESQGNGWYKLIDWTFSHGVPPVIEHPGVTLVDVIYKDNTKAYLLAKNVTWSQVAKFRFGAVKAEQAPTETKIGEFHLPVLPTKVSAVAEVETLPISNIKVHQGAAYACFPHYFKDVSHLDSIDVYRVIDLWNVTDPCIQHAIKKLLVAGGRGHKDMTKDVHEAIVSLQRWEDMQAENGVGE